MRSRMSVYADCDFNAMYGMLAHSNADDHEDADTHEHTDVDCYSGVGFK